MHRPGDSQSSHLGQQVGLSRARNWEVNLGVTPLEDGQRQARAAVERALALNPNLAEAHVQMGRIKRQVDFDWAGGDASLQRAIAREPENSESAALATTSAATLGRFDEALRLGRRAVDLDPLNADSWDDLAWVEFFMDQMDKAATDAKKSLELSPDLGLGRNLLSQIYIMQGRPRDALREIELVRSDFMRAFLFPIAYHALGRKRSRIPR